MFKKTNIYNRWNNKVYWKKGKDNVDWKDFEHLKHEDVGSGLILEKYYLSDSNYLLLIGTSYEKKTEGITLYDSSHKVIKEIK